MKKIFQFVMMAIAAIVFVGCESEKPLNIIDQALPIKASAFYMLGDATPNGWDNGNPTAFSASAEDALLFTWEGDLYTGEMKCCLATGSWDVPFIRPADDQRSISSEGIVEEKFVMWAGDPDYKWRVTEAGKYLLSFNLRNWTMSASYLGGSEGPTIEPIQTEHFYIIGDATPNGWDNNEPTPCTMQSQYIYVYEGNLHNGEMKAMCETGSWDVPFVRPLTADVEINASGVADPNFMFSAAPDNKWKITEEGKYRITFDLQNWTIQAERLGDCDPEDAPIPCIYIVGDATPTGWSIDAPTKVLQTAEGIYEWTGPLKIDGESAFKACREKGDWGAPFIHPLETTLITSTAIVDQHINEYAGDPDVKWVVQEAGTYHITFNLTDSDNLKFSCEKVIE